MSYCRYSSCADWFTARPVAIPCPTKQELEMNALWDSSANNATFSTHTLYDPNIPSSYAEQVEIVRYLDSKK